MPFYECAKCQLCRSNPFLEVLQFCLFPRVIDSRPVFLQPIADLKDRLVLIRCLKLTAEGYCTAWPEQCTALVNDQAVFQGANRSEMLDISLLVKKLRTLKVQLNVERAEEFVWAIAICRKRTREEVEPFLCVRKETQKRSLELLFDSSNKAEVCIPILPTKSHLIPHPVRGYLCTHYACFDLEDWLRVRVAQKSAVWKCPICLKSCLEFKFDEVQYILQTRFPYAIELDVRRDAAPFQMDIREKDPVPGKKPKLEEGASFRFEDFLSGNVEVETDKRYKEQLKALQREWERKMKAEREGQESLCYHPSISPSLSELPFSISRVRTYIELDAD